jgi:hypothetical protein
MAAGESMTEAAESLGPAMSGIKIAGDAILSSE